MRDRIKKFQGSGVLTQNVGGNQSTYIPGQGLYQLTSQLPSVNIIANAPKTKVPQLPVPNLATKPETFEVTKGIKDATARADAQLKKGVTSGISSGLGQGLGFAGSIVSSAYDAIPTLDKVKNDNDATTANIRSTANQALLSGALGPWGMLAGAANTIIDKTGGFTDASEGLGGGLDFANAFAPLAIPGAGWFTKKTIDYTMSDELKNSTGYTGSADKGVTAEKNAGAKILFGKGKANRMIANAARQDQAVQGILQDAKINYEASNNPLIGLATQLQLTGGYQQNGTRVGKSGLKMDREFAKRVVKLSNGKKSKIKKIQEEVRAEEVAGFKNGGAVNVIPDGALHAHKHHLEDVDDKFKDVTSKGIPVITESDGGNITQHAEVEKEEIIFRLDVTEQLEKLMEQGSDEAAIEAGKLLVHEILKNTVDNTGLLNRVE